MVAPPPTPIMGEPPAPPMERLMVKRAPSPPHHKKKAPPSQPELQGFLGGIAPPTNPMAKEPVIEMRGDIIGD
jgi:hypothetical protein